jgi:hypothetical protein
MTDLIYTVPDYLNELRPTERELVDHIVARARNSIPAALFFYGFGTLHHALAATCQVTPLDLDELLRADEATFWHDLCGITRHLDLGTGKLLLPFASGQEGVFLPRCCGREH